MEIITIDAGNTHLRAAKVNTQDSRDIEMLYSDYETIFALVQDLQKGENENLPVAIASVVPKRSQKLAKELNARGQKAILCTREMASGLKINYAETLGIDRIADAVAALELFAGHDLVVIDSGTMTTVDCISAKREFLGGFILPGIKVTSLAVYEKTAALPKCDLKNIKFSEMPDDTLSAVSSGLIADCAGGIEYAIDACVKKFDVLRRKRDTRALPLVIACGGGWEIVKDFVRRDAKTVPELTLTGAALLAESFLSGGG